MNTYENTFEKARGFIYRSARPLDLAMFRYRFENGSRKDVVTALSAYQNPDGGFGWGVEADNFNPDSLPMGVWKATEYLREIGGIEPEHPMIRGILRYLEGGDGFDAVRDQWANTVPSNNDYPCAVWWKYSETGSSFEYGQSVTGALSAWKYNPTAALAGFLIRYAAPDSALREKGVRIAKAAAEWFMKDAPVERHIAGCFISLYEYCTDAGVMPFDGEAMLKKLKEIVDRSICRDVSRWDGYIPRPSAFLTSRGSRFYSEDLEELCRAECEYIKNTQLSDGSFSVPWAWGNDYKEWYVAENWCKAIVTMENMLFLREFEDR